MLAILTCSEQQRGQDGRKCVHCDVGIGVNNSSGLFKDRGNVLEVLLHVSFSIPQSEDGL